MYCHFVKQAAKHQLLSVRRWLLYSLLSNNERNFQFVIIFEIGKTDEIRFPCSDVDQYVPRPLPLEFMCAVNVEIDYQLGSSLVKENSLGRSLEKIFSWSTPLHLGGPLKATPRAIKSKGGAPGRGAARSSVPLLTPI